MNHYSETFLDPVLSRYLMNNLATEALLVLKQWIKKYFPNEKVLLLFQIYERFEMGCNIE